MILQLDRSKNDDFTDCPSCGKTDEDAEHVFFACPRLKTQRRVLEKTFEKEITLESLVEGMLTSELQQPSRPMSLRINVTKSKKG